MADATVRGRPRPALRRERRPYEEHHHDPGEWQVRPDAQIHYQIRNAADNIIELRHRHGVGQRSAARLAGLRDCNSELLPGIHRDPAADLVGPYSSINSAATTTRTNIAPISSCPTGCGDELAEHLNGFGRADAINIRIPIEGAEKTAAATA